MYPYASIRSDILHIEQMILQAHGPRLLSSIYKDLVRREADLYFKVARLDAESLVLWRIDSRFFRDVMMEIDLVKSGQIDDETLYERLPELKKTADRASAAAAAAAASAATSAASISIFAALSAASADTTLGSAVSHLDGFANLSLSGPGGLPEVEKGPSIKVETHLPSLRRTGHSVPFMWKPTVYTPRSVVHSNNTGGAQNYQLSAKVKAIKEPEEARDYSRAPKKKVGGNTEETKTRTGKTHGMDLRRVSEMKRKHGPSIDASDEAGLSDDTRASETTRTKKLRFNSPPVKREPTGEPDGCASDSSADIYASPTDAAPALRPPRTRPAAAPCYPKPCDLCASRRVPCERPMGGGGGVCALCKSKKMKCKYAWAWTKEGAAARTRK